MRQISVTDEAARLIASLRTDEGLIEMKAFLCDAFNAAVLALDGAEAYTCDDLLPLLAISGYHMLAESLATDPSATGMANEAVEDKNQTNEP